MTVVTVVDYGCGNLWSLARAVEYCGGEVELSHDPDVVAKADQLVLPGVGAFGVARDRLDELGLIEPLKACAASGRPFLGICLGMQLLFDESDEFGTHAGLGLIPGRVEPISQTKPDGSRRKVPHIGWTGIRPPVDDAWADSILVGTAPGEGMYFVHSFAGVPSRDEDRLAEVVYEEAVLCAAVRRDNITGTQFHPEKSAKAGLAILERFITNG